MKRAKTFGRGEFCEEFKNGAPVEITCIADGSLSKHICPKGEQFCADDSPQYCRTAVANLEYCRQLPMNAETFLFDDATCRCEARTDNPKTSEECQLDTNFERPYVSPIDDSTCVSRETLFSFYDHTLGPDCADKTADDKKIDFQEFCPPNFHIDFNFCACVSKLECLKECPEGLMMNPLKCGECLTQEEINDLRPVAEDPYFVCPNEPEDFCHFDALDCEGDFGGPKKK